LWVYASYNAGLYGDMHSKSTGRTWANTQTHRISCTTSIHPNLNNRTPRKPMRL